MSIATLISGRAGQTITVYRGASLTAYGTIRAAFVMLAIATEGGTGGGLTVKMVPHIYTAIGTDLQVDDQLRRPSDTSPRWRVTSLGVNEGRDTYTKWQLEGTN